MPKTFEWDDAKSMFRIGVDGLTSEWYSYQGIATLDIDSRHYFGVTAYYEGIFPIEQVLEWKEVES